MVWATPFCLAGLLPAGGSTIRIFYAFLIMVTSVILWMLPMAGAVYDFRTALRTDTFLTATGVGITSANETLWDDLYEGDMGSMDIDSDDATDSPVPNSYDSASQSANITGLTANTTRVLEITYAYDALVGYDAIGLVVDRWPFIWMLLIIVFPIGAFAAMFMGRSD